jgi:hypothetical protein
MMVNIHLTPSESDENGFYEPTPPLPMGRTPEPSQGISRLVFDLPPNPSIDHFVAVILKYPRREEWGRGKNLNPGPIG